MRRRTLDSAGRSRMWPPLMATISPFRVGLDAKRPRPCMGLFLILVFGERYEAGMRVPRDRVARLLDLENHLDLDGDAGGQLGHPDGRPGVPAVFAENLDHEVREAVDHLRLVAEA